MAKQDASSTSDGSKKFDELPVNQRIVLNSRQIGKLKGCRVVGVAGGPEKCSYVVQELGFDAWKVKYREDVVQGLQNAPKAFIGLLEGKNFGKLIVKVAEE